MIFEIVAYSGGRDREIREMVLRIQNEETGLDLSLDDQPDLYDIGQAYKGGGFWVALARGQIVGSIGLMPFGDRGVLKKFFIEAGFRGAAGPAKALFACVLEESHRLGLREIFLDTPAVAHRSHAFYRKQGFVEMDKSRLPVAYDFPDRDSLIFNLVL